MSRYKPDGNLDSDFTGSYSDGGFTQEAKDKHQATQTHGFQQEVNSNFVGIPMTEEQLAKAKAQIAGSSQHLIGGIGQEGLSSLGAKLSSLGGGAVGGGLTDQQGISGQQGQSWGGTYPPPVEHNCPYCGRCRHCGGGGGYVPNYPQPYITWGTGPFYK